VSVPPSPSPFPRGKGRNNEDESFTFSPSPASSRKRGERTNECLLDPCLIAHVPARRGEQERGRYFRIPCRAGGLSPAEKSIIAMTAGRKDRPYSMQLVSAVSPQPLVYQGQGTTGNGQPQPCILDYERLIDYTLSARRSGGMADALASKASEVSLMWVRIPPSAPRTSSQLNSRQPLPFL
jgi:hypothetical protein